DESSPPMARLPRVVWDWPASDSVWYSRAACWHPAGFYERLRCRESRGSSREPHQWYPLSARKPAHFFSRSTPRASRRPFRAGTCDRPSVCGGVAGFSPEVHSEIGACSLVEVAAALPPFVESSEHQVPLAAEV